MTLPCNVTAAGSGGSCVVLAVCHQVRGSHPYKPPGGDWLIAVAVSSDRIQDKVKLHVLGTRVLSLQNVFLLKQQQWGCSRPVEGNRSNQTQRGLAPAGWETGWQTGLGWRFFFILIFLGGRKLWGRSKFPNWPERRERARSHTQSKANRHRNAKGRAHARSDGGE